MTMGRILGAGAIALVLAACGSSSDGAGASGGGPGGGDQDAGTDAPTTENDAGSDAAATPSCPTVQYKTLVVMGDSISDVGGSGGPDDQEPFYRTLLVQNDDTLYPAFQGKDLKTCIGLDSANVVKVSKGGAIATEKNGNASVLFDQVKSLPATLPGPVLVVGTIGGNDVLAGFTDYLLGNAAGQQKDLADFLKGWDDTMEYLTTPDRFGAGVKVDVLITNIYDPTGGTGDFTYAPANKGCGGAFALWPKGQSTDPALQPWNDALVTEAAKYPGVHLLDMHGLYVDHRVNTPAADNWFHEDCIHPNAAGHEHIRELMWSALVAGQ